jgi:hypothetical protein
MNESRRLFSILAGAARTGTEAVTNAYLQGLPQLHPIENDPLMSRGEVHWASGAAASAQSLKISAVLHDLSLFRLDGGASMRVLLPGPEVIARVHETETITIRLPHNASKQLRQAVASNQFHLCFPITDEPEAQQLLSEVAPLIESGRILPRPAKCLLYLEGRKGDHNEWVLSDISSDTPLEIWKIGEDVPLADRVVEVSPNAPSPEDKVLSEVMVPFLDRVSGSDLAKILDDEHDLLVEFRAGIKLLVAKAIGEGRDAKSIVADLIRPSAAKLERRFKHVANLGRLRVGGALASTATLALVSAFTGGIAAAVTTIGSAGGLALALKEYANNADERNDLKSDLGYLLWRLTKLHRR